MIMNRSIRAQWGMTGLVILLACLLLVSAGVGPMQVSIQDTTRILFATLGLDTLHAVPQNVVAVVESIRLPRSVLAAVVGAALAVSGASIQGLFRNPLADPGLIGVSGGAALAAVSMIVLGGSAFSAFTALTGVYALPIAAFCGGFITTLIVARVSMGRFGTSITTMLLVGIAVNIFTGAGIGIFTYIADDAMLRTLTFWTMGSLGGSTWPSVLAASSLVVFAVALLMTQAKALNALLLGESEARHLGIDVERVKLRVMLLAALAVGASVSVSGMIGFIGLVVPHLVRLSIGPDHRFLLPASALLGALLLLAADMLARTVVAPAELPIGLITSILGGPAFIALILYRKQVRGGI